MRWLKRLLKNSIENEDTLLGALSSLLVATSIAVVVVIAIGLVPNIRFPGNPDSEKFGTFGDFIGGALNPVLTFITFMALILTILIQQRELHLARTEFNRTADALESENFEATFFRLSSQLLDIVRSVEITEDHRGVSGFEKFWMNMRLTHRARGKPNHVDDSTQSYLRWYGESGYQLGHYFRFLYNTLKFLDTKEDSPVDVSLYIKLLRSQLSNPELAIIFYNCRTDLRENLRPLVEKYAILNNLPDRYVFEPADKDAINPTAWG